jgi:hypothetical protein
LLKGQEHGLHHPGRVGGLLHTHQLFRYLWTETLLPLPNREKEK